MSNQNILRLSALTIVVGFFSWVGYRVMTNKRVIIPSDYPGSGVAIIFNVKGGQKIDWNYDGYRFNIPSDGILKVSNKEIDMDGSRIMSEYGEPIWDNSPIESQLVRGMCSDTLNRDMLLIYRTNYATFDSLLNKIDPCQE